MIDEQLWVVTQSQGAGDLSLQPDVKVVVASET